MKQEYRYKCRVINVVDGDTVDAIVDLGFSVFTKARLRLSGVDTPELHSKSEDSRILAKKAKEFLATHLLDRDALLETQTKDKYGRYLGVFYTEDGLDVNKMLIDEGYAISYGGGKKILQ